jgi:hypothetical protein
LAPLRNLYAPVAPGPQTCYGANQRALAGPGFACDQHALARHDFDFGFIDHRSAVVEGDRKVAQPQRRPFTVLAARDAADAAGFGPFERIERQHQAADPPRRRRPIGEPGIIVDQPVESGLHDGEGRGCLHDLAEGHRSIEVFGGA